MSRVLAVHPVDPQERLLRQATDVIDGGGVVVYPTDSSYALGCHLGEKSALERIRRIRRTERDHDFTLVCSDLSEIATYARVDNWAYRMVKAHTPGPYTFILKATHDVPKRLRDPKRKAIGSRVPDNRFALALITLNGQPFLNPFDGPSAQGLWEGHTMTTVGVRDFVDGTVRDVTGGIYNMSLASSGATENEDFEFHLTFHDDPLPMTANMPPLFEFFYHLVFEDVELEISHVEGPIPD